VLTSFFWGWVWGPVGLVLAMPITVWVVIVGRYIPGLRSLAILLSNESIAEVENGEDHRKPVVDAKMPGWAD
jgi:predicted PurR-regulated permease PerM